MFNFMSSIFCRIKNLNIKFSNVFLRFFYKKPEFRCRRLNNFDTFRTCCTLEHHNNNMGQTFNPAGITHDVVRQTVITDFNNKCYTT